MAVSLQNAQGDRKRKRRPNGSNAAKDEKPRKAPKNKSSSHDPQDRILLLEEEILESRRNYNNIVELQDVVRTFDKKPKPATLAAVALCRVFCRLIAGESLVTRKNAAEADIQVTQWLKDRLKDYVQSLTEWFGSPDAAQEGTALTLLMRIVKEETSQGSKRSEAAWRTTGGTFCQTIQALLASSPAESARQAFVERYLEEHDDIRFYTFLAMKQSLSGDENRSLERVGNAIDLLTRIEGVPESEDQLEDWYGEAPTAENKQLRSLNAHRKVAQEAWLAIFRCGPSHEQRKAILNVLNAQVLPWFSTRIELIVDFLTDSFNAGGSLSLLALSGIFHLMTEKNLDYPDFYTKLYSLLDETIMHSKHRSRFFRLMEKFLSSSHLPAVMVASFVKRLARLSLQAPPGGIVFVIPWTYNMLKQHPACTFMIHRTHHPTHAIYKKHPKNAEEGMDDPFDMAQSDPALTGAIDSSLWELETLQSHYHPNVATLAKIISEQFTKRDYQLEDFLDHSYAALIDAELEKSIKKEPVVEWEIPKHIVTSPDEPDGLNPLGRLLQAAVGPI